MSDQEILNKRNIQALHQSAQTDRERVFALTERVASLERTVTQQREEMAQLKQIVTMLQAAKYGRGGTT